MLVAFSRFILDAAAPELRREGVPVDVQPRVLSLLWHLARHAGRVVTKSELADAVWPGLDVGDEVIARAVVRARRALGEDAQAPVHLHTEPGRGYRFAGDVLPAWQVLSFVNRSENPALAWTITGLQALLCHVMEATSPGVVAVRQGGTVEWGDDQGTPRARVARLLDAQPKARAVAGEIDEAPGGYRLALAWADPGARITALQFEGASLPALVLQAAEHILPAEPWQRDLVRRHPAAWVRLHETIAGLRRWPRAEAVARLQHRFDALPGLPRLWLQRAELLRELDALAEAEAAAEQAASALTPTGPDQHDEGDLRLHADVLRADVARRRGLLPQARERVDACLAAVACPRPSPRAAHHLARLHGLDALLHREAGDFERSLVAAGRAVDWAALSGRADLELKHRLTQTYVMNMAGHVRAAEVLAQRLVERARELGDRANAGYAMTLLSLFHHGSGQLGDALRWARRAMALALPVDGDAAYAISTRDALLEALVSNRELDQADDVMHWMRRSSAVPLHENMGATALLAWLRWRQGRLDEAAGCYRTLLGDERTAAWVKWQNYLRPESAILLCLLGRPQEAQATLDALPAVMLPLVVGRARAALAMAGHRRDEARTGLTALLPQAKPGQPDAYRIVIDLAWLHLEDGDLPGARHLLERAAALGTDALERTWLELALQDVAQPAAATAWAALRQKSPSLLRHCPWLGTPEDVQARREGRAAPLPNLLTVLAW